MGSSTKPSGRVIRTLLAAALSFCAGAASACSLSSVDIRGPFGQARFSVEIADDPQERAQGLMFRESLPMSAGMLFIYEQPQELAFWMRNTLIPLDMIFIDSAGVVQHVHHNAIPHDLTPIPGGRGIAVLEINGGLAARLGIRKGSEIRHPAIKNEKVAWPCAE